MFTKISKVKFQDQQLDDYLLENSVLKSKLQSKIDALTIMSKELDKCNMDRDKYKVLVEQLHSSKNVNSYEENDKVRYSNKQISGGELLANTRQENNILRLEVESLKAKLDEAKGDTVALRKQLQLLDNCECNSKTSILAYSSKDYENLVQELEKIHKKYQQLQQDYRGTLDEKEELCADRDYYKNKVQRLNHQMSFVLSSEGVTKQANNGIPAKPLVDIDTLISENKYLHERITQFQVEKELLKRNLSKYKNLLENRNNKGSLNLKKGFIDVMTQKQVQEYFNINSKTGIKSATTAELKSLCLGLFEALNDKSIALQHQRKTNQILANRINELEKTLESWCNGQKCIPIFPSQMLLDEFLPDVKQENQSVAAIDEFSHNDKYSDSDTDDVSKYINSEKSLSSDSNGYKHTISSKIKLPLELEELVQEALIELKMAT